MPGPLESEAALARFVNDLIERSRVATVARQSQAPPATLNTISGRVNSTGTIAAGTNFTVTRTAAGRYTITAPAGYNWVGFAATAINASVAYPQIGTVTATAISLTTASTTAPATPIDSAFMFVGTVVPA